MNHIQVLLAIYSLDANPTPGRAITRRASWVKKVRNNVQDKWPYLSLLPERRTGEPFIAIGGVNTVVPIVIRVPPTSEGPDGNPEVALGYEVSTHLISTQTVKVLELEILTLVNLSGL